MSTDQFLQFMESVGLAPVKSIELIDGKLVRFRVRGDKPGSSNGWAVYYGQPRPAGACGSWKSNERHNWRAKSIETLSPVERAEVVVKSAARRRSHDEALLALHAGAREKAAGLWQKAHPATSSHAYLRERQVHAYGIRQLRDMLVIPARDVYGRLHTLQFIGPDGSKRFLTGGRIAGHYFGLGKPKSKLLLGEGYATCATLHHATGEAVAVCFNCGNLEAVARALREKFRWLTLVVCADNDLATEGNPGVTHAIAAAKAVGGLLALPKRGGEA